MTVATVLGPIRFTPTPQWRCARPSPRFRHLGAAEQRDDRTVRHPLLSPSHTPSRLTVCDSEPESPLHPVSIHRRLRACVVGYLISGPQRSDVHAQIVGWEHHQVG